MRTVVLKIKYDGSRYHGWQRQQHHNSVQEQLERALSKAFSQTITVEGSGRTDAGVHAIGQVASFKAQMTLPIEQVKFVVNRLLPTDIYITEAALAEDSFHARYHAVGKTYQYRIYTGRERDPFKALYSYHYPHVKDLEAMRYAATQFIGTHDFRTFMASGSDKEVTVRTLYQLLLDEDHHDQEIILTITGNGFLYNMVRIITGTLLHVGAGKLSKDAITEIILSKERSKAKFTVPACGLYLKEVYYDENTLNAFLGENKISGHVFVDRI